MSSRLTGKKVADRYSLIEKIGEGGMGVVWKAMSFADPSVHYAIKVIQEKHGANIDKQVVALQKEAATISQLAHPLIVDFIEIGKAPDFMGANSYYIVMELAKGITLKKIFERDVKKDIPFVIQLGLQMAEVLDYTHSKGIIHRDIKPQNIMVNRIWKNASGVQFKVLDFGISKAIERIHHSGSDSIMAHEVAGTPLYMAPEQTRLTSFKMDHRADLYSLGCVLYEALTGKPPFHSSSKAEIKKLHAHQEAVPLRDIDPSIPEDVAKIIAKLMSKNPNDRYATAFSLKTDFTKALKRNRQGKGNLAFEVGEHDSISANHISLPIIGREHELGTIESAYKEIESKQKKSGVFLIKGEAGVGKRKLAYQQRKLFSAKNRAFLTVQFSKYEENLPLHSLCNALGDYLQAAIRTDAKQAETINALVAAQNPAELAPLLDKVPLLASLSPISAEIETAGSRFGSSDEEDALFKIFVGLLERFNVPSLFVHDIQWADQHSLSFVSRLMEHFNRKSLFLVLVEQEVFGSASESYERFLAEVGKKQVVHQLVLSSLERNAVKSLIGALVSEPITNLEAVFESLYTKTKGLPLFVVEVVKNHLAKGLLRREKGEWVFDETAVQLSRVAYESSETAARSINNLSKGEKSLLDVASILGDVFSLEDLFYDKSLSVKGIAENLRSLEQRKLIQKLKHRTNEDSNIPVYSFVHKNARRAVYSLISDSKKIELHQFVADLLYSRQKRGLEVSVYRIAHHYNLGVGAAVTEAELRQQSRFVKVNLKAAELAMNSKAWQAATRYLLLIIEYHKKWNLSFVKPDELSGIIESIADLFIVQNKYSSGLGCYTQLLNSKLTQPNLQRVLSKAIYVNQLMGKLSSGLELFRSYRSKALPKPRKEMFSKIRSLFKSPWKDSFDLDIGFMNRRFDSTLKRPPGVRNELLLLYRVLGLPLSEQEKGEVFTASQKYVRDIAQPQLSFIRFYARCVDLVPNKKRRMTIRQVKHPISRHATMCFDEVSFGSEEFKRNLRKNLSSIDQVWDRDVWLEMRLQNALIAWLDLQDDLLSSLLKRLPETIPTRNWYAPIFMSMVLTRDFCLEKRNTLIKRSSFFLQRRKEVGARENDIGTLMVRCLKELAEGTTVDAERTFQQICELSMLSSGQRCSKSLVCKAWYACFLFICISIFETEVRDSSISPKVLKAFAAALKKIRDDVKDTVYSGLVRSIESAFRSKQKESIDAKSSEYPALACLISNWKLVSDSLSGGDLQKLHPAEHLEKLPLFFLRFFPNAEQGQEMSGLHRAKFSKVNAALAHDLNDSPTRVLGEYVDQLKKAGFANKVFILNPYRSSTEKDLFLVEDGDCLGVKSPEMKKYLSAYERIKNAFFVPATDQPWVRPDEGLEATNFADSGQSNERTVVMGSGLSSTRSHVRDVHFGHQEPNEMNAVVPIRSDATSSCVMLLQGIDLQGDTFELREIYEVLGSIVCGILVDDMGDAFSRGAMKLEDCDWLDLWSEGTLRKQREASFYLGLNLSANQYALCYCSVEAGKEIEKFIASSVWHEMHRAKYKNSQSPQSEIRFREVSSAIDATIRNTSNGVQLKNFSCVLSVFDRRSSQVYSVQWGNTRPLVLGSQNYIKTREKSSIGLGAGKIPLFEMNASLVKDGAYILALKLLDNIPKAVRLSMMSERKPLTIGSPEGAQGSVEQLIQEFWNTSGYQPRYFVVVSHKKAKKKSLVAKVDEPA